MDRRKKLFRGAVAVVAAGCLLAPAAAPGSASSQGRRVVAPYRGLGAWIDIFDSSQWAHPGATVQRLRRLGVRTIYLETANYSSPVPVFNPAATARFITKAHASDMEVVAWYLASFANPELDYKRSLAAIRFSTGNGETFDGFGLDIEASVVSPPSLRSKRLVALSRRIRRAVGTRYPLSAIIPSPAGMRKSPSYWPGFPYEALGRIYDVFLPMNYFTYHSTTPGGAHQLTTESIRIIRSETGRALMPIHMVGGIANEVSAGEARAMVRSVREHGLLGASLYDFATTSGRLWPQMAAVPVNPRQSPSLPVKLGYPQPLGNIPGGDRTHPKEVFFKTRGKSGDWQVQLEAFDVQQGEVELWVNWQRVGSLEPTLPNAWSDTVSMTIPAGVLRGRGANWISFQAAGDWPDWSTWAVREVLLVQRTGTITPPASPLP